MMRRHAARASVGNLALKKKGLRLIVSIYYKEFSVGNLALKKKGLRRKVHLLYTHIRVGNLALKKKGLRQLRGYYIITLFWLETLP